MSDSPPGSPATSSEGSPREAASEPVANTATQVFSDHRELLFSIVYNMLGSVSDTEDVVPEPHVRQQVTERFLAAALGGDLDALLQI